MAYAIERVPFLLQKVSKERKDKESYVEQSPSVYTYLGLCCPY